jgi:type II secretory pathway pseudopilin PulG
MSSSNNRREQAGFSIVEMMVAICIMTIVLIATTSLMTNGINWTSTTYNLTNSQQGLRIGQEYITRDLTSAGDGLRGYSATTKVREEFIEEYLSSVIVNDGDSDGLAPLSVLYSDDRTGPSPAGVKSNTDRLNIVLADQGVTSGLLDIGCTGLSGTVDNTGQILDYSKCVCRAGCTGTATTDFQVGEIYFIASSKGATFVSVTNVAGTNVSFREDDAYSLNEAGTNGPLYRVAFNQGSLIPINIKRMHIINYFIDSSNILRRRVFGTQKASDITSTDFINETLAGTVIAENITNLQCKYLLYSRDTDGDIELPVSQLSTTAQQATARQVEVTLNGEYMGPKGIYITDNAELTTSTSIRNVQFFRYN